MSLPSTPDGAGDHGPPRDWSLYDETLHDEPDAMPGDPPPAAREWLTRQRLVHGLLRAMHTDAGAREARVQAILEGLERRRPGLGARRTPAWVLLAAGLLLAVLGWALIPGFDRLPRAEAAVARAADELGRDVDRRFGLRIELDGRQPGEGPRAIGRITLTTRPGGRFLVQGSMGSMPFGAFTAGCDGETLWYRLDMPGGRTVTMPRADAERMFRAFGGEALDLGYFDVEALLRRLPEGFELKAVGRERLPGDEHLALGPQVRVRAVALPQRLEERLREAELWFDEDTGMVSRCELRGQSRSGVGRAVHFDYLGTVELGADAYAPPK